MFMLPGAARRSSRSSSIMVEIGWVGHAAGADRARRGQRVRHLLDAPVHLQRACPTSCSTPPGSTAAGFFRQYWHVALPMIRPGPGVPRHLHVHQRLERLHLAAGRAGRPRPDHAAGGAVPAQPRGHGQTDYSMVMAGHADGRHARWSSCSRCSPATSSPTWPRERSGLRRTHRDGGRAPSPVQGPAVRDVRPLRPLLPRRARRVDAARRAHLGRGVPAVLRPLRPRPVRPAAPGRPRPRPPACGTSSSRPSTTTASACGTAS